MERLFCQVLFVLFHCYETLADECQREINGATGPYAIALRPSGTNRINVSIVCPATDEGGVCPNLDSVYLLQYSCVDASGSLIDSGDVVREGYELQPTMVVFVPNGTAVCNATGCYDIKSQHSFTTFQFPLATCVLLEASSSSVPELASPTPTVFKLSSTSVDLSSGPQTTRNSSSKMVWVTVGSLVFVSCITAVVAIPFLWIVRKRWKVRTIRDSRGLNGLTSFLIIKQATTGPMPAMKDIPKLIIPTSRKTSTPIPPTHNPDIKKTAQLTSNHISNPPSPAKSPPPPRVDDCSRDEGHTAHDTGGSSVSAGTQEEYTEEDMHLYFDSNASSYTDHEYTQTSRSCYISAYDIQ